MSITRSIFSNFQIFFDNFFSVSKESYLERTDACWGVNLFQKCLIIRSKGLGSLWIEFGDRLLKLEKWSNSSNFVKLTVNTILRFCILIPPQKKETVLPRKQMTICPSLGWRNYFGKFEHTAWIFKIVLKL